MNKINYDTQDEIWGCKQEVILNLEINLKLKDIARSLSIIA